ncbi:MAG: 3-hydroxyacyl-CoA dehydrogenase family protein [Proteobacteria bacterium]|nr:3-hydroxyacyl-CoA dehydrogenase family protein [Pseudomonadota bacterium]
MRKIEKVAVFGAGLMGAQIAELFAKEAGLDVQLVDTNEDLVRKGTQGIIQRLETHYVAKGKMTPEECQEVLARIEGTTDLPRAASVSDFVVEAITEKLTAKRGLFAELDKYAPHHAVLASNTSYLKISDIAAATSRPADVVGMHFFNPVAKMLLVEVVKGAETSADTIEAVAALAVRLGKEPVTCADRSFGFLANRAYFALRQEAVQMVWEGVAAPWDIDKALKLGHNLPVGPLELGDLGGSWGLYATSEQDRMVAMGSEKGRLHPLVRRMVDAGYTGGAGKKGVYDYYRDFLLKEGKGEAHD